MNYIYKIVCLICIFNTFELNSVNLYNVILFSLKNNTSKNIILKSYSQDGLFIFNTKEILPKKKFKGIKIERCETRDMHTENKGSVIFEKKHTLLQTWYHSDKSITIHPRTLPAYSNTGKFFLDLDQDQHRIFLKRFRVSRITGVFTEEE